MVKKTVGEGDKKQEVEVEETVEPNPANVKVYEESQDLQDGLSKALRPVFAKHREFVMR